MLSPRSHMGKLHRVIAAATVVCYVWVSAVLPFQHKDCFVHETEAMLRSSSFRVAAVGQVPLRTSVSDPASARIPSHCDACEWQAANVSPALPPFKLAPSFATPPSVVTTLASYLGRTSVSASSRAPPIA